MAVSANVMTRPPPGTDGWQNARAVGLCGKGAGPVGEARAQESQLHVRRAGSDTRQAAMSGTEELSGYFKRS
jgi:hypothetical protein